MVDGGEPRARPLQRKLSRRRQRHAPRRPLDERDAEGVLEVLHHLRDRRLGEIEDAADGPERAVPVDKLQKAQVAQAQPVEMLGKKAISKSYHIEETFDYF